MIEIKQLLIVGGVKRNVGKTTLIERIIKQFGGNFNIIAFKIKTIYPNDIFFHGKERNPLSQSENYRISEETNKEGNEDTNRFLNAGAKQVFMIKTKNNFIKAAFLDLHNKLGYKVLLVCESNSLRKIFTPSLFLFIKEKYSDDMKPSAEEMIKYADKIILTDSVNHDFDIQNLKITKNTWKLAL